jgi:signal transduction histidine kinase
VKNLQLKVQYEEHLSTEVQLSPSVVLNLYRILQEVIQNIIKHSKATEVKIFIQSSPTILLRISDNGKGFQPEGLSHKSGLENMEFRANEINYSIHLTSSPENGTTITVESIAKNTLT